MTVPPENGVQISSALFDRVCAYCDVIAQLTIAHALLMTDAIYFPELPNSSSITSPNYLIHNNSILDCRSGHILVPLVTMEPFGQYSVVTTSSLPALSTNTNLDLQAIFRHIWPAIILS